MKKNERLGNNFALMEWRGSCKGEMGWYIWSCFPVTVHLQVHFSPESKYFFHTTVGIPWQHRSHSGGFHLRVACLQTQTDKTQASPGNGEPPYHFV